MSLELETLTGKIIECAITVHKNLGPGFLESIYQTALPMELKKNRLNVDIQKRVPVLYDGKEIGLHILDLVVEGNVIVELKAVKCFNDCHMAQLLSYLKATEIKVGLLLNFSDSVLKIKRVIN